jgi:hypothetical protein
MRENHLFGSFQMVFMASSDKGFPFSFWHPQIFILKQAEHSSLTKKTLSAVQHKCPRFIFSPRFIFNVVNPYPIGSQNCLALCWGSGCFWASRIRIRLLLGLPDPDLLVRGMDPAPDPSLFS